MISSSQSTLSLEIPRHLNDKRADVALAALLREKFPERAHLSRAALARALKDGQIVLNGKMTLPRSLVATHDVVSIIENVWGKSVLLEPSFEPISLKKVFENDEFLVIDKGAGVQMHAGGFHKGVTIAQWILAHYRALSSVGDDPLRPGIVHRLDRDTSGLLVIAKNNTSFQALKKLFQNHEMEKKYVALVYGHLENLAGKVDASLMRRPGELKRRAIDVETFEGTLPGNTRSALTYYRVIVRYQGYDLVELTPKTGRTHQIRVHLSFLGHPVVGDTLYAWKGAQRKNVLFPERHMLHAASLSFVLFGEKYHFKSSLPEDFRKMLILLDEIKVSSYDDEALKSLF